MSFLNYASLISSKDQVGPARLRGTLIQIKRADTRTAVPAGLIGIDLDQSSRPALGANYDSCRCNDLAVDVLTGGLVIRSLKQGGVFMAEKFVAKASEFKDGDRRIVFAGDNEIGVFRNNGEFYAYSNFCLHQGGPACEGLTIAKVEERLRPDKTSQGLYFSEKDMNFVCPWHGMEYDMKTGECISDRKMKLKKFQVVQKGEDVYVIA
jgi:nitrite reductase/ring-hydroxylating ferredoxin subunit